MHKQHPQTAYRKYAVLIGTIFENCDSICKSGKSADFPDLLFHGEGRNDKWHLPARASCGSVRAAEKVQPCLDGLRWLLSTSLNFSAEIVRTANG